VADWLQAAGYKVRKATDCRSALDALAEGCPALIISTCTWPARRPRRRIAELKRTRRRRR